MQRWAFSIQSLVDFLVSRRQNLGAIDSSKAWSELLGFHWWNVEVRIFLSLVDLLPSILDSFGCTEGASFSHHLLPLSFLSGLFESLELLLCALNLVELRTFRPCDLSIDLWFEGEFILIPLVPVILAVFVSLLVLFRLDVQVQVVISSS